jgi:glycine oxidase
MLAPSIDRGHGPAADFALAARDEYRGYLAWLENATGVHVPLNDAGILQIALTEAGVRGLRRAMVLQADPAAEWLDASSVRTLEPELHHALGAVFHPRDGAVDNVKLLIALAAYARVTPSLRRVHTAATHIVRNGVALSVGATDGNTYQGGHVVLAGGAWMPSLAGLPRPLPVTPLRGQIVAYRGSPLRHVVFGPRGYVVPRPAHGNRAGPETLVGATSERVGFDPAVTPAARESLHVAGSEILPPLARLTPLRQSAGLRPMTPDLLPIIGPDPDLPGLLYACGHSRNGILMAPLTASCIAALVGGRQPGHDLRPFSVDRFSRD